MIEKLENFGSKIGEILCKIGNWFYKYRYLIALIVFVLCIAFEISGSSIGYWINIVNSNVTDDGVLIGQSRAIRTDEWRVLTPMMFSQSFSGFSYFSNLIRGTLTDVFMVYGLPVLNIVQIFRPFQIGFLFLGIAKGLSFFWCGRFIALFLVSLEFFMLLTDKKKLSSFIAAVMITLAPMIQWWFAVNGVVEIFVFGMLAIILLDKYMKNNNLKKRCLYLAGIIICAGGYIMIMYPAWQIPMFYVFLALAIWVIFKNRKDFKINYKDVISIIVAIVIFVTLMGYIFYTSWDTIKIEMNTAYPGNRVSSGGGEATQFVDYLMNIFLPTDISGLEIENNPCEMACMFSLFPIGIILSLYILIKKDKKDLCSILLLIVYGVLAFWSVYGFPEILSKITLLSHSTPNRVYLAIGFLDILILFRTLSIMEKGFSKRLSIFLSLLISCILVYLCNRYNNEYITFKRAIVLFVMCIYLIYFVFRFNSTKYARFFFTIGMVFVMIVCGARVNPIRTGVDVIYDSDVIKAVQEINSEENGKWITEGSYELQVSNYILMAGVPVINTTNVYPDVEKWSSLDEDGEYEEIYNRYAHINMYLVDDDYDQDKFVLNYADDFSVYITVNDLETLDIKYIFTVNDLSSYSSEEIEFEEVYNDYGYYIYKINY